MHGTPVRFPNQHTIKQNIKMEINSSESLVLASLPQTLDHSLDDYQLSRANGTFRFYKISSPEFSQAICF